MPEPSRLSQALRRSLRVETAPGLAPTRPGGPAVLLSPRRLEILLAAASYPGIHLRSLSQLVLSSLPVIRHHIGVLESEGLLRALRRGSRVHLFVPSLYPVRCEPFLLVLGNDLDARLVRAVAASPGRGRRELSRDLGVSTAALDRSLRRLRDAGAVRLDICLGRTQIEVAAGWRRFERSLHRTAALRIRRFSDLLDRHALHPVVETLDGDRARLTVDGPRGRLRFVFIANPLAPLAASVRAGHP